MTSHEIDYRIIGDDIQFVDIELNPGETVIAEAGGTVYMEQGISFDVKMGDGSSPNQGLFGSLKSMVFGGEGLFLATIRGTGKVWLQSMPIRKLIRALSPVGKNSGKESGSILGSFLEGQ